MTTQSLPSPAPTPNYAIQAARRARRQALTGYTLVAPSLLVVALLIIYPAAGSVIRSVIVYNNGVATFSLQRYADFFNNPISMQNLGFTLSITLLTLAFLFLVCFPLALYLRFSNSRIASAVQLLALFPLFVPAIILAYALIRFFITRGVFQTLINGVGIASYSMPIQKPAGIIIGLVWDNLPFTILILTAGLRQIDDALLESARDVGASNTQIFFRIILPLMQRPALIVFSLNFMGLFGSYTLPYLLGPAAPQMMGVYMQRTLGDFLDTSAAETQAVISFIICAAAGFVYVWSVSRQRKGER